MGATGLPGLDECNYALKSAAGVNSLPSQLALVARALPVFVYSPRLDARRQGLQTCMQTGELPTDQPSLWAERARQPKPSLLTRSFFMQTTKTPGERMQRKGARTQM